MDQKMITINKSPFLETFTGEELNNITFVYDPNIFKKIKYYSELESSRLTIYLKNANGNVLILKESKKPYFDLEGDYYFINFEPEHLNAKYSINISN